MNVLRLIINSNSNLSHRDKLLDKTNLEEEITPLKKYEKKILELEAKIEEQKNIINELKKLLNNQSSLTK
jgi:hypothetical protein